MGEQQIQQDDLKYEPDPYCIWYLRHENDIHPVAEVIKTRYPMLKKGEQYSFTPELMLQVKAYLEEGADPLELLEQQRKDYIEAAKNYLDTHPTAQPIWQVLKKDVGHEETKLTDLPLAVLKNLYIRLTN